MERSSGTLGKIRSGLQRNRLGEVLVRRGIISPTQLKSALSFQSEQKKPLGEILIQLGYIKKSDIVTSIAMQWSMRFAATALAVIISTSSINIASAKADTNKPAVINASTTSSLSSYPDLFGTSEKRSSDLSAFTKWSSMFSRFDSQMNQSSNASVVKQWKDNLESMRGLPLDQMVDRVNNMANAVRYVPDNKLWGKSDYWETPIEFFSRGAGDCEDYAITKYASLRALGVPDSRMRVAIVKDTQKNIPHAILIVYTDKGPVILDNQIKSVRADNSISHYKPIFSINRTAWWLHGSGNTLVASR